MTEDEAKTKTCPQTLMRHGSIGERGQADNCIGSACMAWRSTASVEVKLQHKSDRRWDGTGIEMQGWRYVVSYDDGMDRFERAQSDGAKSGYCGLAGLEP